MGATSIGFIGAGQMARALARGFVRAGLVAASDLVAADPVAAAVEWFARELPGARVASANTELVRSCGLVFLATKPQHLPQVAAELAAVSGRGPLFVSILAGVPLARLGSALGSDRVIRVMPNTPSLVGSGAAGMALGPGATQADGERVRELLESTGVALTVDESLLDAVTGLSGSGPAYVFTIIEALSDGGVRMGLPRQAATTLAAQTVLGAARMVLETKEHPALLRERVASPAGTTIAGLQVLERYALRAALMDAVEAATLRSRQLGEG
jgi:pyrroline-5-carboxylate reductase